MNVEGLNLMKWIKKGRDFTNIFFEIKADFNKLEMIRVNSTITEENFPFSLTNFQYNNLTPEKKYCTIQ